MLVAQCNGYRMVTPLVLYKTCLHYANLAASGYDLCTKFVNHCTNRKRLALLFSLEAISSSPVASEYQCKFFTVTIPSGGNGGHWNNQNNCRNCDGCSALRKTDSNLVVFSWAVVMHSFYINL